jgi:hypothetical protein
MGKYLNKPAMVPNQERELYPLFDAALALPYNKAIVYEVPKSRASYLYRVAQGLIYRNAIESISTYTTEDYFYGRGLYYHIVVEIHSRGLVIANVENPPHSFTWDVIKCAATQKPVPFTAALNAASSRLNKLRINFPEQIGPIYIDAQACKLCWAVPKDEELVVVDIDVGERIPAPTKEQKAKLKQ